MVFIPDIYPPVNARGRRSHRAQTRLHPEGKAELWSGRAIFFCCQDSKDLPCIKQDYKRIQIQYVERAARQCRSVFGRKEHYVVVPKIEMKTRAVDNRAVLMKALARRIGVGA